MYWCSIHQTYPNLEVISRISLLTSVYNIVCTGVSVLQTYCLYTDVNECLEENGGCAELCNNTAGSFFCSCFQPGYEITENSINCTGMLIKNTILSAVQLPLKL